MISPISNSSFQSDSVNIEKFSLDRLIDVSSTAFSYASMALPFISSQSSLYKLGMVWSEVLDISDLWKTVRDVVQELSDFDISCFLEGDFSWGQARIFIPMLLGIILYDGELPILHTRGKKVADKLAYEGKEGLQCLEDDFFVYTNDGQRDEALELLRHFDSLPSNLDNNNPWEIVGKLLCDKLKIVFALITQNWYGIGVVSKNVRYKASYIRNQSYASQVSSFCGGVVELAEIVLRQRFFGKLFLQTDDPKKKSNVIRDKHIAFDAIKEDAGFIPEYFGLFQKVFFGRYNREVAFMPNLNPEQSLPEGWLLRVVGGKKSIVIDGKDHEFHIFERDPILNTRPGYFLPHSGRMHEFFYRWMRDHESQFGDRLIVYAGTHWIAVPTFRSTSHHAS